MIRKTWTFYISSQIGEIWEFGSKFGYLAKFRPNSIVFRTYLGILRSSGHRRSAPARRPGDIPVTTWDISGIRCIRPLRAAHRLEQRPKKVNIVKFFLNSPLGCRSCLPLSLAGVGLSDKPDFVQKGRRELQQLEGATQVSPLP